MGGEVVVPLCWEAAVPRGFVLPEVFDGSPDFVGGEGAFLYLPLLGVVEDFGEAVDFVSGVWVQCLLGGGVLVEEAVLGRLEHCGGVAGEGGVFSPDCGDGAVADVGHGVVQVAYGLVGESARCVPFMFLGDALLSVGVPLL